MATPQGKAGSKSKRGKALKAASDRPPAKRFGGPQILACITGLLYGIPIGAQNIVGITIMAWWGVLLMLITAGIMFTTTEEDVGPLLWLTGLGGGPLLLLRILVTRDVPWNFWFTMLIWVGAGTAGIALGLPFLGDGSIPPPAPQ